jgi:hypothetical protein
MNSELIWIVILFKFGQVIFFHQLVDFFLLGIGTEFDDLHRRAFIHESACIGGALLICVYKTGDKRIHLSLDPSTYHGRNQYEDTATAVSQNAIV